MRSYLLLAAAVLSASAAQAQSDLFRPGYIVRASAPTDTVRGYIDVYRATGRLEMWGGASGRGARVRFRPAPDGPVETLRPAQLAAAGTADQRQAYRTKWVPGDSTRLLEVLAAGSLTLYTGFSPRSDVSYFLEQQGGQLLPLPKGQFLPILQGVVASCQGLTVTDARKRRYTYSRESLVEVVDRYNSCQGSPARTYAGARREGASLSIRAGAQHSTFTYQLYNQPYGEIVDNKAKARPMVAGQLNMPLVANLSAVLEVGYSSPESVTRYRVAGSSAGDVQGLATMRAAMLQVPIMLRWQFSRPERRLQPYAQVGVGRILMLSGEARFAEPAQNGNVPSGYSLKMQGATTLLTYGAGLNYRTPIGRFGLAVQRTRLTLGSVSAYETFRLRQADLSLVYQFLVK